MTKGRILVADNDELDRQRYAGWLRAAEFDVVEASSVHAAMAALREGTIPDLAVLDVRLERNDALQDESGLHLARDCLDIGIPVLVLTGEPNFAYVRKASKWRRPSGAPDTVSFMGKKEVATQDGPKLLVHEAQALISKRNVFIVHGHDIAARDRVELFVLRVKLNPIVLCDQVDRGRSILQKLDEYAEAGFVIVILTPDDECASKGQGGQSGNHVALEHRARQNVIFELGYFTAKYGPARVKALVAEGVQIPSDYLGIVYIPFEVNSTDWEVKLAKEMKAAGIDVQYP